MSISLFSSEGTQEKPRPIKVVVVTMFESGANTGDKPGELQHWIENLDFEKPLVFPLGKQPLYVNADGLMLVLVGGGIANAAASIIALGADPRFDFSRSYWLVAGIAGGDPQDISLGSAAWAQHVVDGDLLYELDAREIPEHWPYGMIPLGSKEPILQHKKLNPRVALGNNHFALNKSLAAWAYSQTANLKLEDSDDLVNYRALYRGFPNAQRPPFVTMGDTLSASTYWHGKLLNQWANDWVQLYAGEQANFVTANMEDSGTLTGLYRLADAGLVDRDRIMILRTVSNFTQPPPGKDAVWSKTSPYPGGGGPALKTAFIVGNKVVQSLITGWPVFKEKTPGSKGPKSLREEH